MSNTFDPECLRNVRIAIICEGSMERVIMETLLASQSLVFDEEQVIPDIATGRATIPLRSADKFADTYLTMEWDAQVVVIRVLDSLRERFVLPKAYRDMPVYSFHTRPEIEHLVILAEGQEGAWQSYSQKQKNAKPSGFCRSVLGYTDVKREDWARVYWQDPDDLRNAIREYHRIHRCEKNEYDLMWLLK